MICSKCGYDNPEDSRFCEHCGVALVPDSPVEAQAYQQSIFYEAASPKKPNSVLVIIGLVMAILALLASIVVLAGWILGCIALVICMIALITKRGGKGLSIVGVVIAALAIVISSILFADGLVKHTSPMGPLFNQRTSASYDQTEHESTLQDESDTTGSSTYTVSNELGSFTLPSTWVMDYVNSQPEEYSYVYAPNTASSYEASDYVYIVGAQTSFTYSDRDALIQYNKDDITSNYSDVEDDDIEVYVLPNKGQFDAPMIAYNFQTYDGDMNSDVDVWEYHLVYDHAIAMFISYNIDSWTDVDGNPKDIAYDAAESFTLR